MQSAPELMGISEIAELLGVSRQRVDKISRTDTSFPAPIADLHAGRIWLRDAIDKWVAETRS